jgi:hypothetical protein
MVREYWMNNYAMQLNYKLVAGFSSVTIVIPSETSSSFFGFGLAALAGAASATRKVTAAKNETDLRSEEVITLLLELFLNGLSTLKPVRTEINRCQQTTIKTEQMSCQINRWSSLFGKVIHKFSGCSFEG